MTLSELINLHLSDVGLFQDFMRTFAIEVSLFTIILFCVFNVVLDFIEYAFKKITRYIILKRHGAIINDTIDCIYILFRNNNIAREKADIAKDALVFYAWKKKIKI